MLLRIAASPAAIASSEFPIIPDSKLAADGPMVRNRPMVPKDEVLSIPVSSAGDYLSMVGLSAEVL